VLALFNNFDLLGENEKRIEDDVVPLFIIEKNKCLISMIPESDILIDLLVFSLDQKNEFRKRGLKEDISRSIHTFITSSENDFLKDCVELNLGIRKEYLKKSVTKQFDYTFSFKKVIWRFLVAVLTIIAIFLLNTQRAVPYTIFALIAFAPFTLIYIQYIISNYGYHISLSRGSDIFSITKKGIKYTFNKKDIDTIEYYHSYVKQSGSKCTPFENTAYIHIKFQNGTKIILNTLTIDRDKLDLKFRDQKINMHVVFIPYIRR